MNLDRLDNLTFAVDLLVEHALRRSVELGILKERRRAGVVDDLEAQLVRIGIDESLAR